MWSKLLGAICTVVSYLFSDARQEEQRQKKAQERRNQIDHEVRTGDADAVNGRIGRNLCIGFLFLSIALCGCASTPKAPDVVYVNEPDRVYPMEREGVSGWWVPCGIMARMIDRIESCSCGK